MADATAEPESFDRYDQDQHKEHRHGPFRELLDAGLDPGNDDERHGPREDGMDQQRRPGRRNELAEIAGHQRLFPADEIARQRLEQVLRRPAADDIVVAQNQQRRHDRDEPQPVPVALGIELAEGTEGIRAAAAADDGLTVEDGKGQQEAEHEVQQHEGRTAVLPDQRREAPDVAEPDGGPGHGHDDGEMAAECLPVLCHNKRLPAVFAGIDGLSFHGYDGSSFHGLSVESISSRKQRIRIQSPSPGRYGSRTC